MANEKNETQDNLREIQVADHLNLIRTSSRILHDADDIDGNKYELKSVTKKKGVSTARQVHKEKINKWRSWYWIIAMGQKIPTGMQIDGLYALHPNDLEPFFQDCERKIDDKWVKCQIVLEAARAHGLSEDILASVAKTMAVGTRLDDPNISRKLIQTNGFSLSPDNKAEAQKQLKSFLNKKPLN